RSWAGSSGITSSPQLSSTRPGRGSSGRPATTPYPIVPMLWRHVLKWGIEVQPFQQNQPVTKNFRGTINFQDKTWTGLAYGDFLLGLMRSSSLTVAAEPNYARVS